MRYEGNRRLIALLRPLLHLLNGNIVLAENGSDFSKHARFIRNGNAQVIRALEIAQEPNALICVCRVFKGGIAAVRMVAA